MELTGYRRACGKRSGGIRSIALVGADAVTGAGFDRNTGTYTDISLRGNAKFSLYHFKEDEARYNEALVATAGPMLVQHKLEFTLGKIDRESSGAAEELCRASADGIIAIVTTNNGVSLLVGYSEKFGTEYPLRMDKCSADSGRKITDAGIHQITLSSKDTANAKVYSGEINI